MSKTEIQITLDSDEERRIRNAVATRHNQVQERRAQYQGQNTEELSGMVQPDDVNLPEAVMKILEVGVEELE